MSNEVIEQSKIEEWPFSDRLLDVAKIADELGIAERTVWRSVQSKEIPPPVKIGRNSRWFTSDLLAVRERLRASRN